MWPSKIVVDSEHSHFYLGRASKLTYNFKFLTVNARNPALCPGNPIWEILVRRIKYKMKLEPRANVLANNTFKADNIPPVDRWRLRHKANP